MGHRVDATPYGYGVPCLHASAGPLSDDAAQCERRGCLECVGAALASDCRMMSATADAATSRAASNDSSGRSLFVARAVAAAAAFAAYVAAATAAEFNSFVELCRMAKHCCSGGNQRQMHWCASNGSAAVGFIGASESEAA